MTTQQIIGLVVVGCIFVWAYLPNIKALIDTVPQVKPVTKAKPDLMKEIEDVVAIRQAHATAEVTKACNSLLEVLLKVKT